MTLANEKKIVIKAINDMGRRVSAADVATKTGLPVNITTRALNQIAEEAAGHLQVSKVGDIAYIFPAGYQAVYLSRGLKSYIEKLNNKLFEIAFFILRISFGLMLILSLVTIALAFFLVLQASSRGRDSDNNDGFAVNFDFFDWMILRDLIYWQISSADYNDPRYQSKADNNNFLYNCFSFLFGDGNPNVNLEQRRWHGIAQLIRENKGVVTVDQIAPFIGNDPSDEDQMLSVLVRFDGRPEVTESGHIIYLFPAMQATAISDNFEQVPAFFQIFPWKFSQVEESSLFWVIGLAAINFLGSWFLYFNLVIASPILALVLLILVVYGTLFVAVPFIRYLVIQRLNQKIEAGNDLRKQYADRIENASVDLKKKLAEAHEMAISIRQIKSTELVYDTDKDLLEQKFQASNNS